MSVRESFYGTIALGCVALLVLALGAYWLAAWLALKTVAVTAVLAYLTQATATAQVQAEVSDLVNRPGLMPSPEAHRMHRIAMTLWLATVVAGGVALCLLLAGV